MAIDKALYIEPTDICPICGRRIKLPYTGLVTSEQLYEDSKCCLWIEQIDEGRSTIGYRVICKQP